MIFKLKILEPLCFVQWFNLKINWENAEKLVGNSKLLLSCRQGVASMINKIPLSNSNESDLINAMTTKQSFDLSPLGNIYQSKIDVIFCLLLLDELYISNLTICTFYWNIEVKTNNFFIIVILDKLSISCPERDILCLLGYFMSKFSFALG